MTDSKGNKLSIGDEVSLCGLIKANHLNCRYGEVSSMSELPTAGRVTVKLFPYSQNKEVAVKPANLIKNEDSGKHCEVKAHETCTNCGTIAPRQRLMCCSKCQLVVYCSKQCQREHWVKQHKSKCKMLRELRKGKQSVNNLNVNDTVSATIQIAARLSSKHDYNGSEKILRDTITQLKSRGFVMAILHTSLGFVIGEGLGRVKEGIEQMKFGIGIYNDNIGAEFEPSSTRSSAHNNLAILLSRQGELEECVEHCWKAYELDPLAPSRLSLLCQIGSLQNTIGNYEKGEEAYQLYLSKAAPFDKSKRPEEYEEAVAVYTSIGRIKINLFWSKLNATQKGAFIATVWVQKQVEDIRTVLQKALEMDPSAQDAKDLLANLDKQLKI